VLDLAWCYSQLSGLQMQREVTALIIVLSYSSSTPHLTYSNPIQYHMPAHPAARAAMRQRAAMRHERPGPAARAATHATRAAVFARLLYSSRKNERSLPLGITGKCTRAWLINDCVSRFQLSMSGLFLCLCVG